MIIRAYETKDLKSIREIWNYVVNSGDAFPQDEPLTESESAEFFASQTLCSVAESEEDGSIVGLYILHPNNIGHCGHICNASFAVSPEFRGRKIGEKLVRDCLSKAPSYGFRILQLNAVVRNNLFARHLYEKVGFERLGTVPGGFKTKDGAYQDICLYYIELR